MKILAPLLVRFKQQITNSQGIRPQIRGLTIHTQAFILHFPKHSSLHSSIAFLSYSNVKFSSFAITEFFSSLVLSLMRILKMFCFDFCLTRRDACSPCCFDWVCNTVCRLLLLTVRLGISLGFFLISITVNLFSLQNKL